MMNDDLIKRLNAMPLDAILGVFIGAPASSRLEVRAREICYDRQACAALGLDYINMPRQDYIKAVVYAILEAKHGKK